jgi:hypothetical protein
MLLIYLVLVVAVLVHGVLTAALEVVAVLAVYGNVLLLLNLNLALEISHTLLVLVVLVVLV